MHKGYLSMPLISPNPYENKPCPSKAASIHQVPSLVNAGDRKPEIWGYVRASTSKQVYSPTVQATTIAKIAKVIDPTLDCERGTGWVLSNVVPFMDLAVSGEKVPWYRRHGFMAILNAAQPGDHLVTWRFDRLDRDMLRAPGAIAAIRDTGLRLHVEEYEGGREINLDSDTETLMVVILTALGHVEQKKRTRASQASVQHRKAMGLLFHANRKVGYRRVTQSRPGQQRTKYYVHHEGERMLVREAGLRSMSGQTAKAIHADFAARGERTAEKTPWSIDLVVRVTRWWRECYKRGVVPFEDCDPYDFDTKLALD